ncbi:hypothetical protein [Arenimonas terrae]|jgi:hypothetical protein|uniref:Uncharacterized protein n=1 Tax=Arenimonas terrae TaxID=2546226 RepID=A0A5C4RSQ7_9GAMM|nr:hypothetical protein [Arenimonas terrae]TNJ33965.1 hypothetical protein E1B00_11600 [Arenimonas terrae]
MKTRSTLSAALSISLLSGLALSNAHAANDNKQFSPAECQPYGQTSTYDTLAIRADGVQNKTTNTNKYTICPIVHDADGSWSADSGLTVVLVFAYAGNGTIECTLTVGIDTAGIQLPATQTVAASPFLAGLKIINFTEMSGTSEQPGTVVCRLPPGAKLSYIRSGEEAETDTDPPAP